MRVLFLNHNVAWGGGTFFRAYHLARHLVRRGHDVTLVSIDPARRWGFSQNVSEGVTIVSSPDLFRGSARTGWDPWDTANRVRFVASSAWDVVHAWDCRPAVILPALAATLRGARPPLVVDWCDWWGRGGTQAERPGSLAKLFYGPIETFFEERFRTSATRTTVASEALRERAISLGVPASSISKLWGGCDAERLRPMERAAARSSVGVPGHGWVVGYLGAIHRAEVPLLMDALHCARQCVPTLLFRAVGSTVAGTRTTLSDAAGPAWTDWMSETGRLPLERVAVELSACDALALPMRDTISNRARWPSKINDYLAVGRPIVATRVGEIAQLEDRGAALFTDDSAEAIAAGLVQIARDPNLADRLGRKARALATDELDWHILASGVESLYESAVSHCARRRVPAAGLHPR